MRRRLVLVALVLAPLGALASCSGAAPERNNPTASRAVPSGGQRLADLGIKHGPEGFSLPTGPAPIRVIDQPNVVTLLYSATDSRTLQGYLEDHQDALGMSEVRSTPGSMTFTLVGWEGGFTTSTEYAGLTLRRKP